MHPAGTLEWNEVRFLVSAGEASGDMYAASVVGHLRTAFPSASFYGCAGPKMQDAGVTPVIDSTSLAVVGLAEVVGHLPRIYGQYRKLIRFAEESVPTAAILTDSPDFHLRVARHLKRLGVPVFYLVAPQVWAWRQERVREIARLVDKLFCLFPFEESWFRERGVDATYIGHPLAAMVSTTATRAEFFDRHRLPTDRPLVTLLPGSRAGEAVRHLPVLLDAVALLRQRRDLSVLLATPKGFAARAVFSTFRERIGALSIQVIENEAWDCIGHADLALAASGTVTVEAAILGTPMVTYYKVNPLSWWAGRRLVKVPFLSMVNLIAGRQIVPELIQYDMTPARVAAEAENLLAGTKQADRMREDLAHVRAALTSEGDPLRRTADLIGGKLAESKAPSHTLIYSGRQ
ncbi:MAG: lipid-A-disaccharide synthase [Acidobacteriaceae bacterium]|nr:lipid-A-disaccharide synthase [Acidobacteriaceae bacterium]